MSTLKWDTVESIQTYLTTGLNSLANSTSDTTGFSAVGAEVDNETDKYEYIEFELNLAAQGSARSTGARVEIWVSKKVDGSNYSDDTNAAFVHQFLCAFQLDAATTARRQIIDNIPIAPSHQKYQVRNVTGQAFAASGSTLKYRRYNQQVV